MQSLFEVLWSDFVRLNPQAELIEKLLLERGETEVENDHIALRTMNIGELSLKSFTSLLEKLGYEKSGDYFFEKKKLKASHFENKQDPKCPKIFVSELLVEELSDSAQRILNRLATEAKSTITDQGISLPSTPWNPVTSEEYLLLLEESEYAAWLAAFGLRANHFTVNVNRLKTFSDIHQLNTFLEENAFELNSSGGIVKGSEEEGLAQSSTMAAKILWSFADKDLEIRSCFYEFAERFPLAETGELFQGFIAKSADKIFESTNIAA